MAVLLTVLVLGGSVGLTAFVGETTASHGTASQTGFYTLPDETDASTPIISTRGHFKPKWFLWGFDAVALQEPHGKFDYETSADYSRTIEPCPPELVVYVHGFDNSERAAIQNFNIAADSLATLNYDHPVVGFSWDSNPGSFVPVSWWDAANEIADRNGPKLATYLQHLNTVCSETRVRIVAHSLGSRVVLSAIESLGEREANRTDGRTTIRSIHFLGAAVPRNLVTLEDPPGAAIQTHVGQLHSKYSRRDEILTVAYPVGQGTLQPALGKVGAPTDVALPVNYHQQDVTHLVGGSLFHHSAYSKVTADGGAMDTVTWDWANEKAIAAYYEDFTPHTSPLKQAVLSFTVGYQYSPWRHPPFPIFIAADTGGPVGDAYLISVNHADNSFEVEQFDRAVSTHDPAMWTDGADGAPRSIMFPETKAKFWGEIRPLVVVANSRKPACTYREFEQDGDIHHAFSHLRQVAYRPLVVICYPG